MRYRTSLPAEQYRYREAPSSRTLGNIFDLGWRRNLAQIMGRDTWMWFVPFPLPTPPPQPGVSRAHKSAVAKRKDMDDEEEAVGMLEQDEQNADEDEANGWPVYSKGLTTGVTGDGTWYPVNEQLFLSAQDVAVTETETLRRQQEYRRRQQSLFRNELQLEDGTAYSAGNSDFEYYQQHQLRVQQQMHQLHQSNGPLISQIPPPPQQHEDDGNQSGIANVPLVHLTKPTP